jgi:hypothetical protein
VAAISLAADLKLSFPYLPSESNPADFPSRGRVRKRTKFQPRRRTQQSKFDKYVCGLERASRRLRASGALLE